MKEEKIRGDLATAVHPSSFCLHPFSVRGHAAVADRFRRAIARGRLASTFLFVGPAGIGKRTFALWLAQGLLCERVPEERLSPCGECPSCRQVASLNHPDIEIVTKPDDKAFIPLERLIGDAEHRMRAGLCYNIALKPFSGRRKVAIIDDADYLNKEGANCLLKTLEEPPPRSVLILIGTSEQRQLPTIRSRCQIVRFQPLAESDVAELLLAGGNCDSPELARSAAAHAGGSLERARLWCNESILEFRGELLRLFAQSDVDRPAAAKLVNQFVDAAGKESAAKRQRLRLAVSLAEEFYRAVLWAVEAGQTPAERDLAKAVGDTARWLSADAAAGKIESCLEAYNHIDANAHQATLVDWWIDELALREAAMTK
jgi:DNA polymerase-3 subunit delta'